MDAVTGTAGNDTISGARVDSVQTWNSTDKIDGGAGNDSFTAVIADAVTPTTGAITGVENITVTLTGTTAKVVTFGTADASKAFISGVETLTNLASTGVLTFAELQEIPAITLNNTAADTVVSFAEGVLDGTADAITLNVIGNTGAVTLTPSSGEDIEALTVNATTAASTVAALGVRGGTVKSVVVTGDADLSFGTTASFHKVTSFDASEADGDITAVFDTFGTGTTNTSVIETGAGDDSLTISGMTTAEYTSISVNAGAGKDTVVVGTALSTKHTIDGGAGTDTLSINTGGTTITVDNVALVNNQTSNFEVMEFANRVDVLNASSFTGFTDYVFTTASATSSPAQTVITGLSSGNTLTFRGDLLGVDGVTSTAGKSALSLTASGTKQTAKLTLNSNESGSVSGLNNLAVDIIGGVGGDGATTVDGVVAQSAITFGAGIDTLQIVATKAVNIIGGKGGDGAAAAATAAGGAAAAAIDNGTSVKMVVLTGDGAVTIDGGAVGATAGGAGGAASTNGFTGAVTVDASALKGALNIQGSAGEDTIIGGKGADIIRAGGSNDTIDITAGGANKVVFEATVVANGIDTIKGFVVGSGSSKDILNFDFFNIDAAPNTSTVAADSALVKVTNLSGSTSVQVGKVTIVDFKADIGSIDFGSTAGFVQLFGAGKALSDVQTAASSAKSVVVVQGTDRSEVYFVDNAATNGIVAAEVTLVGVLEGVTNADTLVAGNFII